MSRGPLFFLFLLLSCVKPDFEDKSITTSLDLGVKHVRTYYVDTYGDQLNRDGKLVGEALFADDGSLMNIKTSRMNLSEHQSPAVWIERYSGIPVNRLIWELDGGIYGRDWWGIRKFLTSGPEYAFDVGKDKATTHLENPKNV